MNTPDTSGHHFLASLPQLNPRYIARLAIASAPLSTYQLYRILPTNHATTRPTSSPVVLVPTHPNNAQGSYRVTI